MIHPGLLYRLDISTIYFYEPLLIPAFFSLIIHKHLVLLLSSITFTAKRQVDNHFYECIYLFQILYNMKSVFH